VTPPTRTPVLSPGGALPAEGGSGSAPASATSSGGGARASTHEPDSNPNPIPPQQEEPGPKPSSELEAVAFALNFLIENPDYLPDPEDTPEENPENLEKKRHEPHESSGRSSKSKKPEPPRRQATLEEMPAVVRTPRARETCKPDGPSTGEPPRSSTDCLTTTEEPPRKCDAAKYACVLGFFFQSVCVLINFET